MHVRTPGGVQTVCPHAFKDNLWWMNSLTTDRDLVMQHIDVSSMLVVRTLRWTIRGEEGLVTLVDQPWVEKTTIHKIVMHFIEFTVHKLKCKDFHLQYNDANKICSLSKK